jgi:hypothetical protein
MISSLHTLESAQKAATIKRKERKKRSSHCEVRHIPHCFPVLAGQLSFPRKVR